MLLLLGCAMTSAAAAAADSATRTRLAAQPSSSLTSASGDSPIRMQSLGVYDIMSEETTPLLWHGQLMVVEKIGGNQIILPGDQRQKYGSYFRLRQQALLGHGSNDVVVPVVPGSRFLSYVSGYVDDTNASNPTIWVFGTNDCPGDDYHGIPGSCRFNSTDAASWIPCTCHDGSLARSEVWALWSSDPQLSASSWQKQRVITMPPELPIFNTDVTKGADGDHVMTFETNMWHADTQSHGYYNLFALCYKCGPNLSRGWTLLNTSTHKYWGNDHTEGHGYDYGDPTIRYLESDGYFYLVPATPLRQGRSAPVRPSPFPCCFTQWVARSRDLMTWVDGRNQGHMPFMGWPGPHMGPGPQGNGDTLVTPGSVLAQYGTSAQQALCHNKTDNINRSDGDWVELPPSFTAQLKGVHRGPAVYVVWISGDQVVLGFGGHGLVNASQAEWLQSYF